MPSFLALVFVLNNIYLNISLRYRLDNGKLYKIYPKTCKLFKKLNNEYDTMFMKTCRWGWGEINNSEFCIP